jgi:holin-like protein
MAQPQTGVRNTARLLVQIALLWAISEAARRAAAVLPVPVPAGAVGLVLLYGLLSAGWLRLAWIDRGATFLVRHLGLFLVPFGVGFIAFGDAMAVQGIALAVVLIGGTVGGIGATGLVCGFVLQLTRRAGGIGRRSFHE